MLTALGHSLAACEVDEVQAPRGPRAAVGPRADVHHEHHVAPGRRRVHRRALSEKEKRQKEGGIYQRGSIHAIFVDIAVFVVIIIGGGGGGGGGGVVVVCSCTEHSQRP